MPRKEHTEGAKFAFSELFLNKYGKSANFINLNKLRDSVISLFRGDSVTQVEPEYELVALYICTTIHFT